MFFSFQIPFLNQPSTRVPGLHETTSPNDRFPMPVQACPGTATLQWSHPCQPPMTTSATLFNSTTSRTRTALIWIVHHHPSQYAKCLTTLSMTIRYITNRHWLPTFWMQRQTLVLCYSSKSVSIKRGVYIIGPFRLVFEGSLTAEICFQSVVIDYFRIDAKKQSF